MPARGTTVFLISLLLFGGLFFWEGIQYSVDRVFGTKLFYDVRQDIKIDFVEDIFFGFLGVAAAAAYSHRHFGKLLSSLESGAKPAQLE